VLDDSNELLQALKDNSPLRVLNLRNIFLSHLDTNSPVKTISELLKVLEERKEPFKLNLEFTSLNEEHGEEIIRVLMNNNGIIIDCIGIMINNNLEGSTFSNSQEQHISDIISKRKALYKS